MTEALQLHDYEPMPETYFAPAERASPEALRRTLELLIRSPLLDAALTSLGGWVAVLNRQRQVLTVNDAFLKSLGIADAFQVLGLRPGEIVNCLHAADHPGGCGTGRFCMTCGAAIAIVAAQCTRKPQERECVLTCKIDGAVTDQVFAVRCRAFQLEGEELLLIAMRDIGEEKRRIALEHTFLHDVSNVLTALDGAAETLYEQRELADPRLFKLVRDAADTLVREVRIQRLLARGRPDARELELEETRPSEILNQIEAVGSTHRAAKGQSLDIQQPPADTPFETDRGLLMRILVNMIVNAFEAGRPGDRVRLGCDETDDAVTFHVWNRQSILEEAALRVFQQYFSTKEGEGRGLGTFAMKLLGEMMLGGEVSFTSSPADGTTFRIRHPRRLSSGRIVGAG